MTDKLFVAILCMSASVSSHFELHEELSFGRHYKLDWEAPLCLEILEAHEKRRIAHTGHSLRVNKANQGNGFDFYSKTAGLHTMNTVKFAIYGRFFSSLHSVQTCVNRLSAFFILCETVLV